MIDDVKVRKRAQHRIAIFVDKIEQLFNSMDPSPFYEKISMMTRKNSSSVGRRNFRDATQLRWSCM